MSLPSNGYLLDGACSTEEGLEPFTPTGADVLQELQAIREEQRELRLMQLRHKQDINSLLAQGRKAHEDMERLFGSVVMLSGRVDQVVAQDQEPLLLLKAVADIVSKWLTNVEQVIAQDASAPEFLNAVTSMADVVAHLSGCVNKLKAQGPVPLA